MGSENIFNNFSCGATYGFLAAVILLFVIRQIDREQNNSKKMSRTLDKFSEAEQSSLTPMRIVRNSLLSTIGCAFWIIVLIAAVILIIQIGSFFANF
jgi:hypothetical protein